MPVFGGFLKQKQDLRPDLPSLLGLQKKIRSFGLPASLSQMHRYEVEAVKEWQDPPAVRDATNCTRSLMEPK